MSKKVVIIGGGIMGVCSAYFLHKEGHEVTIIDKSNFSSGASYVNAGYITPSHIISLAAPGIITKGLKWMFNPASPFYVKPRLDKNSFCFSDPIILAILAVPKLEDLVITCQTGNSGPLFL